MGSIAAQLLVLRKRTSTWILMGIWVALGIMFSHLLPYLTYRGDADAPTGAASLQTLLPEGLATNLLAGFPFFGGVFALMLGVLAVGSDYGWDTWKTMLTQRSGRVRLLSAKVAAVAVWIAPFVLFLFLAGAAASIAIAGAEDAAVAWPSLWELLRAVGTGWFILATWAAFGVMLAVLSRGTALAIGLGILYTFVIEGIFSALAGEVGWLDPLVEFFLRANAYSLVVSLGVTTGSLGDNGPGGFFGPFVDGTQAIVVMGGYMTAFLLISAFVFRRRDVG
jgi:ABC-2 type transport system permease protein